MRETMQITFRRFQPGILQRASDARAALLQVWRNAVNDERLSNDLFDGLRWVERFIRVLKDHLYFLTDRLALPVSGVRDVLAFKDDISIGRFFEPHQSQRQRGFAAPAFTNEGDHLTAAQLQIHIIYGMYKAIVAGKPAWLARLKVFLQVFYFENEILAHKTCVVHQLSMLNQKATCKMTVFQFI